MDQFACSGYSQVNKETPGQQETEIVSDDVS